MSLLTHELVHLSISLLIGYFVWQKYKKTLPAFIAALLGGFIVDIDHLFDYYLVFGFNFKPEYFLNSYQFSLSHKVFVPLHAWEWVILLIFFSLYLDKKIKIKKQKVLKLLLSFTLALALGLYSHLIIDTITNDVKPLGYSIIFRAVNNFYSVKISKNGKEF